MTKDEALKLALEALETFALWESEGDEQTPATKAITAIKEALAQPEQPAAQAEPVSIGGEVINALKKAHELGFLRCAGWTQRDDLFADVGSAAYRKDRDHDLSSLAALETTKPVPLPVQPAAQQPKARTGDCLLTGFCAAEGHKIQKAQPVQEPGTYEYFKDWMVKEMPPMTTIGNPEWWAKRIYERFIYTPPPLPVQPAAQAEPVKDMRHVGESQFEAWWADYRWTTNTEITSEQISRDSYAAGMGDSTSQPAAQAEPVAYRSRLESGSYKYCNEPQYFDDAEALYATPQAAQAEPLTNEQIELLWDKELSVHCGITALRAITRAIEAAHGIGAKP